MPATKQIFFFLASALVGLVDSLVGTTFFFRVAIAQLLELDVLELHLHRRSGVQLQGEDALVSPHLLMFVDEYRHHLAVDLVRERESVGNDVIVVPVLVLDRTLQFRWVADLLDYFGLASFVNTVFSPRFERMPRNFSP